MSSPGVLKEFTVLDRCFLQGVKSSTYRSTRWSGFLSGFPFALSTPYSAAIYLYSISFIPIWAWVKVAACFETNGNMSFPETIKDSPLCVACFSTWVFVSDRSHVHGVSRFLRREVRTYCGL